MKIVHRLIVLAILLAVSAPARSQGVRRPGANSSNPNRSVNAAHERAKTSAQTELAAGRFDRSLELVAPVLRVNPSDHVAWYLQGSAHVQKGEQARDADLVRKGINDVREAVRLGGREHPIYYFPYLYGMTQLAILENRDDHAEVAVNVAGQLLLQQSLSGEEQANVYYQRGLAQKHLGKMESALADFDRAIALHPQHLAAHLAGADVFVEQEKTSEAETRFGRAVRRFSSNPVVFNNRGMFRQRIGRYDDAIADFSTAIRLNASFFAAYTNRGSARMAKQQYALAEADLTRSLQLQPAQPLAFRTRGTVRLSQGKLDAAIADYTQAVRLANNFAPAHADLGFARWFQGNPSAALASFDRALALDKTSRYLLIWRYLALRQLGRDDEATQLVESELQEEINDDDFIGQLFRYLGDRQTEAELLARVENAFTDQVAVQRCEAQYFIGYRKRLAGDASANTHFEEALKTKLTTLTAYRGAAYALGRSPAE